MRSLSFKIIILALVFFKMLPINAQFEGEIYFVQFVDKPQDIFSLGNPGEFLSQKAIQRRLKSNIDIELHDLPVNLSYIELVRDAGAEIIFITKWLNGVGIDPHNDVVLKSIRNLDCVRNVELIQSISMSKIKSQIDYLKTSIVTDSIFNLTNTIIIKESKNLNYGIAEHQIKMLNGDILHERGFLGEGMTIAVLDNGFLNVDQIEVFDSIWIKNQVLSTHDFVKRSVVEFDEGSHGTKVLSIMAANSPGKMIGTAPHASYHLIRTEIADSESMLEEYLWMCGAEYADSVGADIINSSLGYTIFDDETQNHTYSDLDGNTTIVTRAADMAASKGILVVNSAGNYGNKSWHFVGAPSDGDSVLSVGAVDENEEWAVFSSVGPTADGRIKPNIVAQGINTAIVQTDGNVATGNGTSFSSPVIAGLAACLWQNSPTLNNMQILESIEKSGSFASLPNEHLGYGIPNFDLAMQFAEEFKIPQNDSDLIKNLYPNPFTNRIKLLLNSEVDDILTINIFDLTGKNLFAQDFQLSEGLNFINLSKLNFLRTGIYIIQFKSTRHNIYKKIVKLN